MLTYFMNHVDCGIRSVSSLPTDGPPLFHALAVACDGTPCVAAAGDAWPVPASDPTAATVAVFRSGTILSPHALTVPGKLPPSQRTVCLSALR